MLRALRVRDLAVIEQVEIELGTGFCALTGETGAGKSILVDALTLALGARASAELVRTGAEAAEVEALFDLSDAPAARERLAAAGLLDPGETELVVRRQVSRQGRGRVWLNGRIESAGRLFEVGRDLVDIYGQHDYQTLQEPEQHLKLLDGFGGYQAELEAYRADHGRFRALADERESLWQSESARREREELLRFRVREIDGAGLEEGEDERLLAEREVLRHAGLIRDAGREAAEYIYESESAVTGGLAGIVARLREAGRHDPRFAGPAAQVEEAAAALEDAARELARLSGSLESDPARLEQVEDRIELIRRLKRKYGETIAEILRLRDESAAELKKFGRREERLRELERELAAAEAAVKKSGAALSKKRRDSAGRLRKLIETELSALGLAGTRFEVRFVEVGPGQDGMESGEFYLSPNPGEDLKPLAKIASGGELSRIMLGLRALAVDAGGAPTLVFDEVDQGVGGAAAEAVGLRLKKLADRRQVLCVTHLPQIAALAGSHLLVEKRREKDRARTVVRTLSPGERVEEISRMLGGREVTEAARAHAREMLASTPAAAAARSVKKTKTREAREQG